MTSEIKLLNIIDVAQLTGLSKPTIYRQMNDGDFPRPLRLSKSRVAWRLVDLLNWVASRPVSEGF